MEQGARYTESVVRLHEHGQVVWEDGAYFGVSEINFLIRGHVKAKEKFASPCKNCTEGAVNSSRFVTLRQTRVQSSSDGDLAAAEVKFSC